MAGSRPVTAPTLAAAGARVSRPAWFLQIDWSNFSTRLCTGGEQTWNDFVWAGGGFEISGFTQDGKPNGITLIDPSHDYRTLVLTDGIRDRFIQLWKGYVDELADDDPALIFQGYADGFDIAKGRVSFALDWQASSRAFSPREMIGPAIGVNWCAVPGTSFTWGGSTYKLEARPRG